MVLAMIVGVVLTNANDKRSPVKIFVLLIANNLRLSAKIFLRLPPPVLDQKSADFLSKQF